MGGSRGQASRGHDYPRARHADSPKGVSCNASPASDTPGVEAAFPAAKYPPADSRGRAHRRPRSSGAERDLDEIFDHLRRLQELGEAANRPDLEDEEELLLRRLLALQATDLFEQDVGVVAAVSTLTLRPHLSKCVLAETRTPMDAEQERAICQRYANRIRAYGLCHLREAAAADDLVQQVLLVVLEALREGKVNDIDNLDKYVFGTCRNMAMSVRRGDARQRRIADEAAKSLPERYDAPWDLVDHARLDRCLERLEERARAVVLATFIDERDADEIGRSMSVSAGNVRVIRHRALAHLHECMDGGLQA